MAYYGDYYRGDYYRGDYYRGDPIFGALVGGVARLGAGLVKKGVGAVARGVVGVFSKKGATEVAKQVAVPVAIGVGGAIAGRGTVPPLPPPGQVPKAGVRGAIERALPFGETGYVKRRRMNVTNVKALRKAIRRATGFAKLARKCITFVSPRAPKGKAIFRRKR